MNWSVTVEDSVAYVTFTRPPDNQLSFVDLRDLDGLLTKIGSDSDVSVIVLQSGCPGYFLGHADLADIERLTRKKPGEEGLERWLTTMLRIESVPQPVVAAIDGQAWGGGCESALASTFRIGSPATHFSQMEILRGAIPGAGATQRLPRVIGHSKAAHMLMTGRRVEADEALRIGLLDAIIDDADFAQGVRRWVAPIAEQPRKALIAIKESMAAGLRLPPEKALRNEQRLFHEVLGS